MQDELQKLLQKRMDRRAFLQHVMVGFVAMTGIAALLKTLNGVGSSNSKKHTASYGGGSYGGSKKP